MSGERTPIVIASAGLLALGVLGTFEIWQALYYDVIGIRAGGVVRAESPILFWFAFCVSILIALPMWLMIAFVAIITLLRLASRKAI